MKTLNRFYRQVVLFLLAGWIGMALAASAEAGEPYYRYTQQVQGATAACTEPAYQPLGTFYPQPYTMLPANGIAGGGYSPMNMQGAGTLAEYGPLSLYRQVAIPATVYSRGYDGLVRPSEGTTLVYPNLPAMSPINGRTAISFPPNRRLSRPFQSGGGAINWLDQN